VCCFACASKAIHFAFSPCLPLLAALPPLAESTNGTFLNSRRIDSARYVELKPGDVLRFGLSSRDFVLLHDEMAR